MLFWRTPFRTIRRCSSSLDMWFSSPRRSPWRPCVLLSTTSSRSAVTPWSCAPAYRGPLVSGWRTSASGRSGKDHVLGKCQGGFSGSQQCSQVEETALTLTVSVSSAQTAMEAMGLIAIIVNCYLIGQCGQLQRLFPWLSPEMTIISIVLLEVCMMQWRVFQALLGFLRQNVNAALFLLELTLGLV